MKYLMCALAIVSLLLIGCMQNAQLYYWGNYSTTLYNFKKNPTEEARLTHIESIKKIINKSKTANQKVPPGVYAELAMLNKGSQSIDEINALLNKEKELYPESTKLVEFIRMVFLGEGVNDKKN